MRKCDNFTLLLRRGRHGLVHKSVPHVQHDYSSSLDQSNPSFVALSFPLPSSMLESLGDDDGNDSDNATNQ